MPWIASLAAKQAEESDVAKLVRLQTRKQVEASREAVEQAAEAVRVELEQEKTAVEQTEREQVRHDKPTKKLDRKNTRRRSQRQLSAGVLVPLSSMELNRA
eukprot:SAG31_NODE_25357_length_463_cov_0.565934_1_plen_101_part_00